jgi:hypothetical protein
VVVLIIGQRPDPHIDAVAAHLTEAGESAVVLDRNTRDRCCLVLGKTENAGCITCDGERIPFSEIAGVWWRVKPSARAEFGAGSESVAEALKWKEWRHLLCSLPHFLNFATWINPLRQHFEMSYKPVQLALATELGFAIPDTVVTNDADDVLELFKRNPRVIYKTLSSFLIPPDEMIFTNEVTRGQVLDDAGAIGLAPGIFQELVEKKYELRVTVVGDSVFAVRIESQKFPENSIDWRRNQFAEMYVPTVLRLEEEQRLKALHSRMGLVYAAYDFVVDQKDELVFLECNPGGQWLWLEQALDLPISHTLAETLRRRDLIAARV